MANRIYYLLSAVLFYSIGFSQDTQNLKFGKISTPDFQVTSPLIDSNVNAVIIADVGKTYFVGNTINRWISYVFEKHIRIKIINKKSIDDLVTIKIPLYGRDNYKDKLEISEASTYNIENGAVVETKVQATDIFEEKYNSYVSIKKFALPAVKEGSIIDYSYKITSYHYSNIPSWSFQHLYYPCLLSDFEIAIPQLLRFTIIKHGVDSFYMNKSDETRENLFMSDLKVSSLINKYRWVMKNIVPFKVEDFLFAPTDYLDKLEFNLAQTYNGSDVHNIMTDWKTVNDDLMNSSEFGLAIDKEYSVNLFNTADKVCSGVTDPLEMAKRLYTYVRDNFTVRDNDYIYMSDDLYNINKKRSGNTAELNLLLTALLRQRDIKADPVILSTREYGVHPVIYPVLNKMNYVICMAKINGDTIFLDATHPRLGFGKLPVECYNGHARIISQKDSGSIYLYPDNIKETKTVAVSLSNGEKQGAGMSGTVEITPGLIESFHTRDEIAKKGIAGFTKDIKLASDNNMRVTNVGIDSLQQYDLPIMIHYDITADPGNGEDFIYFTPMLLDGYKDNPFAVSDRKYPVEMPFPLNEVFILNMEIPEGYKIEELPKSTKVKFNENEGLFEYIVRSDSRKIQLICKLSLYEATFYPDDYQTLRDFFAYVVKKESEQIVFKKIK